MNVAVRPGVNVTAVAGAVREKSVTSREVGAYAVCEFGDEAVIVNG